MENFREEFSDKKTSWHWKGEYWFSLIIIVIDDAEQIIFFRWCMISLLTILAPLIIIDSQVLKLDVS